MERDNNELTTEQRVASEEEQTQVVDSTLGQSETAEESSLIPEKFVGKSPAEIARAYMEVERDRGRLASELGSLRQEREALEEKYRQAEREAMRYQQMPPQVQSQVVQSQSETDPYDVFNTKFADDPSGATVHLVKEEISKLQRAQQEQLLQERQVQAYNYYLKEKEENPDFGRREPNMQQLETKYRSMIRPEYLKSKEYIQMLDLMSRGQDVAYYEKKAVEKAQKDGLSVLQEKRKAQSESSSSSGGGKMIDFKDLPLEEMEKYLGVADK